MKHVFYFSIYLSLFFYGLFYKITSSEFWPVTISKTWFTPESFEYSMLQKPLLTFFLSFVHLLPLDDLQHIIFVKIIFCIFGLLGLILFSILTTHHSNINKNIRFNWVKISLISLLLVFFAPLYLSNFFSVRSDQVAFTLFCIFLYLCELNKKYLSLAVLVLIPLFGIKEIIFLIPGGLYYLYYFKNKLSKKSLFISIYCVVVIMMWFVSYNMPALYYLSEAHSNIKALDRLLYFKENLNIPLLFASLICILDIFRKRIKPNYPVALGSLIFLILLFVMPQAYEFYVASLLPFIYWPVFLQFNNLEFKINTKTIIATLLILFTINDILTKHRDRYLSNIDQLTFIQKMTPFLQSNNFNYLDGVGTLPRQKFSPCFISPYDELANTSCTHQFTALNPDVIIITGRLNNELSAKVFGRVNTDYTQIFPNVWVYQNKITEPILKNLDLSANQPIPIFIF